MGEAKAATATAGRSGLPRRRGEFGLVGRLAIVVGVSVVESLMREGITPISPDEGVRVLRRLVSDPDTPPVV